MLGRRQLFVRLADCNLACAYCDTDHAAGAVWRAELWPGSTQWREFPNPAALPLLTTLVEDWQSRWPVHHSLALTGGEPLLQSAALAEWLPAVSRILPVFLETNGTLPDALARVLPFINWVSMDVKLASATGEATPWDLHARFLAVARTRACQVKAVIDTVTSEDDIAAAAKFVRGHGADIPFILQPRTVAGRPVLSGNRLLALQTAAAREHPATLVIPQLHPLLELR